MPFITSTLSSSVEYTVFHNGENGPAVPMKTITIRGGANVANAKNIVANGGMITPQGFLTPVTDEEVYLLKKNHVFAIHEKNGFVKIINTKENTSKSVRDMNSADNSAPYTEKDYKDGGRAKGNVPAPKVGKVDDNV